MLVLLIQLLHCFQIQSIVLEDDHILGCQISLQHQMQADVLLQRWRCECNNGAASAHTLLLSRALCEHVVRM